MTAGHRFVSSFRRNAPRSPSGARGLTLVELMISMLLGLLVVGSASAIFLSNRQTYRATEALGRIQEGSRMAFELMARDVREAGGNPCGKLRTQQLKVANVLNSPGSNWWSSWNDGLRGYDGTVAAPGTAFGTSLENRIANTDAIDIMSGDNASGVTVVDHVPASAQFHLNTVNHTLDDGDIALVCDFRQASLFQVSNAQPGTNEVVVHNTGNTVSPGNCTKGLGYPVVCTTLGTPYEYGPNSMIVRLHAVRWYIGRNENGRSSLFRTSLVNNGGVVAATPQEIAEGVSNMTLQYLVDGNPSYVDANLVPAASWVNVVSVRIRLDLESNDRAAVDGNRLQRQIFHTVTLRNRLQ